MSIQPYDVCFLGCGTAAAIHLLNHQDFFRDKRILILEKGQDFPRNKTFCSFSNASMRFLETQKWFRFKASYLGSQKTFETTIPYQYLDSHLLFDALKTMLQKSPHIDLRFNTSVSNLHYKEGCFLIDEFRAHHVIDSRPIDLPKPFWIQHFYGLEIEFDEASPVLEPMIMDIDSSFGQGLKFFYLIPKAKNRLLVELTFFSDQLFEKSFYKRELEAYIHSKSWKTYRVRAEEYGEIPLVRMIPPKQNAPNYHSIGIRAGNLRASTGYSVWRSHLHSRAEGPLPKAHQDLKWRLIGWMDEIFLRVLQSRPDCAAELFSRFFERLTAKDIAQFMSENPSWMSLMRVVWIMPKLLFLKALIRRSIFLNRHTWRCSL